MGIPCRGVATAMVSLRRSLPAGLIDAASTSIGGFAVGLAAVVLFDEALLGVYAVFFTAHQLGLVVPMQLIYFPAEVVAVTHPVASRLSIMRRSFLLAAGPSATSGVAALLAAAVMRNEASIDDLIALGVSSILATILAPAQAHVRRMLHLANEHWMAAYTSVIQLVATGVAIGALWLLNVPDVWLPFGALSIASLVSLVAGLAMARPSRDPVTASVRFANLIVSGRWLLATGGLVAASRFAIASVIGLLAGAEELGYAEAARLAGQPIIVVALGISAVLGPKSMEAAARRNKRQASRLARTHNLMLVAVSLAYLLVAGGDWAWNPLARIIPTAYVIGGLAALTIVANVIGSVTLPAQRELLGGRYERRLTIVEVFAGIIGLTVSMSASVTKSFARPLSLAAQNLWRVFDYRRALQKLYASPPATEAGGAAGDGSARDAR